MIFNKVTIGWKAPITGNNGEQYMLTRFKSATPINQFPSLGKVEKVTPNETQERIVEANIETNAYST